jgi:cytochrome c oxidase assembly protein subunit 11
MMAQDALPHPTGKNRKVGLILLLVAVGMVGAAYSAVPLYYAFCAATGYGGTTRVASEAPKGVIAREMTVAFDGDTAAGLPWKFVAAKPVTAKIGSVDTAVFTAQNLSNHAVTGQAVYNVTPELAGQYFNKIQCFCFNQQTLKPGESVEMPVTFFVDPAIDKDPDLKTVKTITLHYTFYAAKE